MHTVILLANHLKQKFVRNLNLDRVLQMLILCKHRTGMTSFLFGMLLDMVEFGVWHFPFKMDGPQMLILRTGTSNGLAFSSE